MKRTHQDQAYGLLPCPGSPCVWTAVLFQSGEDPSVKGIRSRLSVYVAVLPSIESSDNSRISPVGFV